MKAFQRALALLLALITVLTLTACGQKPAAQPEQVQEPAAEQSKPAPAEEPAAEEASDAEQTPAPAADVRVGEEFKFTELAADKNGDNGLTFYYTTDGKTLEAFTDRDEDENKWYKGAAGLLVYPALVPADNYGALGTAKNTPVFFLLVLSGLMACIAGSYASSIFGSIFQNLFGIEFTMAEDGIKLTTASVILPYIVKTAVLPALIEEFAMRGVVMQSLRKYGDWFAIIMSSLVFALLHGNMVQIPFAFIAGIAIGYAVTVTGSMWTGILIHFLNNLASIIMQIGIDNCSETVSAVITMSVVFVIMISGIICAAIYFKNYSHAYPLKNGESLVLSWNEKTRAFVVTAPMIIAICLLLWETAMYIEF